MPNWLSSIPTLVAESRRAQDLPPKIEDPAALAIVAVLLQSAMTANRLTELPKDRVSSVAPNRGVKEGSGRGG